MYAIHFDRCARVQCVAYSVHVPNVIKPNHFLDLREVKLARLANCRCKLFNNGILEVALLKVTDRDSGDVAVCLFSRVFAEGAFCRLSHDHYSRRKFVNPTCASITMRVQMMF